jgi:hypothetical protein
MFRYADRTKIRTCGTNEQEEDDMCVIGYLLWIVLSIAGRTAPSADVPPAAGEGCFAATGSSCSYRAERVGGIQAVGSRWRVDIVRHGRTVSIGPADLVDAAGRAINAGRMIRPGDRVTAWTSPLDQEPAAVRVGTLTAER